MANLTIKETEKVLLTAEPQDAHGVKRAVDGSISWTSSNEAAVTLVPSLDGVSVMAVAVASGVSTITATADADLTAGVRFISGTFDLEVSTGEATKIVITAGVPEAQ